MPPPREIFSRKFLPLSSFPRYITVYRVPSVLHRGKCKCIINENVTRMEDFCNITELEGGLIKPWFASLDRT